MKQTYTQSPVCTQFSWRLHIIFLCVTSESFLECWWWAARRPVWQQPPDWPSHCPRTKPGLWRRGCQAAEAAEAGHCSIVSCPRGQWTNSKPPPASLQHWPPIIHQNHCLPSVIYSLNSHRRGLCLYLHLASYLLFVFLGSSWHRPCQSWSRCLGQMVYIFNISSLS